MRRRHAVAVFVNLVLAVGSWAAVVYFYPTLPEQVPTHFGFHGPPNAWGSKETMFLLPAVQTALVLLLVALGLLVERCPGIYNFPVDPRKLSEEGREELYSSTRSFLLSQGILMNLLFGYIQLTTIQVALDCRWWRRGWAAAGINGGIMAFLLCSIFGVVAYYFVKQRRLH